MSILSRILIAVAVPVILAPSAALAQEVPGQYIVVLEDAAGDPDAFARNHGFAPFQVYRNVFPGFAARIPPQAAAALQRNPHVAFVQPDSLKFAIAQVVPTGIDRIDAEPGAGGAVIDVDVAVIDTGIDLTHPDLNVVQGVDCRKLDRLGNCKVGGNDDNGHGSHVAGTIAARDNDLGVVGVAPGARLHAVKVLDSRGSGYTSWIIQGIDWVAAHADVIEVANMSLGGLGTDDTDGGDCNASKDAEHLAICRAVAAGVTFVVAAGNEMDDARFHRPAAFDEVITVSALADFDGAPGRLGSATYAFSSCTESVDDSFACFSNYGPDVDIMAPGVGILSTYMTGGYATSSGTSMASPHVAGAAALVLAAGPGLSPAQVKAALIAQGDPAPCADGPCADDPDGVQEPLLKVVPPAPECAIDADCTGTICCGGKCVAPACVDDASCGDGDACTIDACAFPGTCLAACGYADVSCSGGLADGCCPAGCDDATDIDCPATPPAFCGDGVCAGAVLGEDCATCAADCVCKGRACTKGCCGNGACEVLENVSNCPVDCG
jgi:subtilisin family serine protease